MSEYIITTDGELYHHGVKGMKWGVRKKTYASDVKAAKSRMKDAARAYNKSYNKAHNRAFAAFSPSKKQREANDKRWEDAYAKANNYYEAKREYNMAKKSYKELVKSESKKIRAGESFIGKLYGDITGAHRYQAEFKLADEDRARRT